MSIEHWWEDENWSIENKTHLTAIYAPHIPHGLAWDWTRVFAVKSQRAMAQLETGLCSLLWPIEFSCNIQPVTERRATTGWIGWSLNTLRTGDADLRFYITTLQDGWRKSAFLTCACFPCTLHLIMQYIEPVSEWSCWRMFVETWPHSELTFRHRASSI